MRNKYCLNTKWAFSKEAEQIPETMPEKWIFVSLPHTWNDIDGQDGGSDYYRGTCYYAKQIRKEELPENARYYLEINGANSTACVYWNGKKLAQHDGGYSTWRVEVTEEVRESNLIVITVDNSPNRQVYPQHADFTFYGGLYRDVNLIAVPDSHFDLEDYGGPGIRVTPKIQEKNADVLVDVKIRNPQEEQTLIYRVKNQEGETISVYTCGVKETEAKLSIPDVRLWHGKKDPYLYSAEVVLWDSAGKELDRVSARFGCRTFEIHPEKGFLLNGESYPLRGVSRHQDRWGVGNALLPEHHEEDMNLICELGATSIRLAHYQHDSYFYDLCDERGMVVWAEIPYISSHMPEGRKNSVDQMKELIIQNYNHPSIVVWGLSNEITMSGHSSEDLLENHRILNDLAHELDPSRKTTVAAVTMCDIHDPYLRISDVVAYNHYFGWYGGDPSMNGPWFDRFHKEFPELPIGCSEYGCEALNWHSSHPEQGDYTEEYQAYYHEELIRQFFTRPYLWATYVWNMFDFGADARNEGGENGQNHKGLVTFDRKYKKDSFYAYKAWLSEEPFVHICGKRYVDRAENVTKVTVYSNQPEVELFVNGKSLETKQSPDHFFYFQVPNAGESDLTAVAGTCRDESHIRKVDELNPAYRLTEQGAVLNWFDLTEKEGYYSLNDKISEVVKSEDGRQIIQDCMDEWGKGGENAFVQEGNSEKLLNMMGNFTVLRMLNTMGAVNDAVTKDQMLELNARLNQIAKGESA